MDIKTLSQFMEWVENLESGKYVFRGVIDESYKIEATTYLRLKDENGNFINQGDNSPESLLRINQEIINQARHQGHYRELNDLDLLAELQHFGAATCLIDFTENPLIALWMACREESDENTDGKVYAVDIEDQSEFKIVDYNLLKDPIYEFFKRNEQGRYQLYQWVPNYQNNGRVLAQQSIFLFGGEEIVETYNYIVPKDSKKILRNQLNRSLGIDERSLFPDFAGFARQQAHDRSYDRPRIQIDIPSAFDSNQVNETSEVINNDIQNESLAQYYLNWGREMYQKDMVDEAIQIFSYGISLRPRELLLGFLYSDRAFAYYNTGELQLALEDYNESICLIPDPTASTYYSRGRVSHDMGAYVEALDDFDQAISRDSGNADYYFWRAMTHYKRETYSEALFDLDRAIERDSENADYYFWRAMATFDLGQYQDSMSYFNSAININPINADFYYWNGRAQYNLGRYLEALDDFDRAIERDSENADYYFWRAMTNKHLGVSARMQSDFQMALVLAEENGNDDLMDAINRERSD